MSQFFAFGSAVLFGFGDFTGGVAARRLPVWTVMAWSQTLGLGVLGLGLVLVRTESVSGADIGYGALAGLVGIIGLGILYGALADGMMLIVAPISGAVGATLPVVVDVASGTSLSTLEKLGIAGAIIAVLLIGGGDRTRRVDARVALRAVLAGAALGMFFIALAQTSSDAGLWPLVSARAVAIPFAVTMALVVGGASRPRHTDLGLVATAGSLDMAANVSIALALQRGPLGVNSVLSSLYPTFTAIAAIVLLDERPTKRQSFGIGLALVAAVSLAV